LDVVVCFLAAADRSAVVGPGYIQVLVSVKCVLKHAHVFFRESGEKGVVWHCCLVGLEVVAYFGPVVGGYVSFCLCFELRIQESSRP